MSGRYTNDMHEVARRQRPMNREREAREGERTSGVTRI